MLLRPAAQLLQHVWVDVANEEVRHGARPLLTMWYRNDTTHPVLPLAIALQLVAGATSAILAGDVQRTVTRI